MNVTLAKLYILCGLPFSGKSTLAKELVKTYDLVYIACKLKALAALSPSRIACSTRRGATQSPTR